MTDFLILCDGSKQCRLQLSASLAILPILDSKNPVWTSPDTEHLSLPKYRRK
jgi:hypothetical protein